MSLPAASPQYKPDLDVLVCNYNTASLIPKMMDAIREASPDLNVRTFFIDNASTDNSVEVIRSKYPESILLENKSNVGFGRANNQLLPYCTADFLLLLNTDAFVDQGAIRISLDFMRRNPRCGILGAKLKSDFGELQPSCRYFPTPFNIFLAKTGLGRIFPWIHPADRFDWAHDTVRECDWVPGCYYMVRKSVVDHIGLFDPRYFLYYEEVDHCKRTKGAGWSVYFHPEVAVVHIGGESAKSSGALSKVGRQISSLQIESEVLYLRKHHGVLGLILHILLTLIAENLFFLKDLSRLNKRVSHPFGTTTKLLKSIKDTKMGTKPTR